MGINLQDNSRIGIVLAVAVASFALFFANVEVQNFAYGIRATDVVAPAELSATDFDALKGVVLGDSRVQEIIANQPYDVMSYDFISNANDKPVVWQPELHINVANKTQITAVISLAQDAAASSVTRVETYPMIMVAPMQAVGADSNHGFAINYYTGGSTINGLRLSHAVPSTVGQKPINLYWGVNAVEYNAVESNSCSAAHFADAYFAQSGAIWATTGAVLWADTATNCQGQLPVFSANVGDTVQFKVYVDSSNRWTMYGVDLNNGQQFIKTRSGVNYLVMKTSTYNTGVFMESLSSTVNGDQLSSPRGTAKLSTDKGVTWTNWQSAARNDQSCTNVNHIYPYDANKEVISGNLASGGSATWNPVRMGTYYPAC